MRTGRPPPPPRGPGRGGLAVGIRSAQPRDMLPAGQEIIPQGEGLRERPANPALGVEGIEEHAGQIVQERFELAHVIPQLDPGITADLPIHPAQIVLADDRRGLLIRVSQKGKPARGAPPPPHPPPPLPPPPHSSPST